MQTAVVMKGELPSRPSYSVDQVLDALRTSGRPVLGNRSSCPAHDGDGLNLAVYSDDDGTARPCCHSRRCETHEILAPLRPYLDDHGIVKTSTGNGSQRRTKSRPDPLPSHESVLSGYAAQLTFDAARLALLESERAISPDIALRYRLGIYPSKWKGRRPPPFTIPIRDEGGNLLSYIAHWPKSAREPDQRGVDVLAGWPRWPLACLDAEVYEPGDLVVVAEGELDALAIRSAGFPAYGAPGASSWHDAYAHELRDIYGATRVVVIGDRDKSGADFVAGVVPSCRRAGIDARAVDLPEPVGDGGDATDFLRPLPPEDRRAAMLALIEGSPHASSLSSVDVATAQHSPALASERDIPGAAVQELHRCGVVGEERVLRLIYLVLVSRLLDKIVSLVVMGPSSVGKSHTTSEVIRLFPPSATYALTSMSERALVYSEEPLQHRILVLYEAAALNSDFGTYVLRSLMSEGRIRYETVDRKTLKAVLIEREGPTGVIVTTTATHLEHETQTRMLATTVTDTPEQTRAILAKLADDRPGIVLDVEPWHELQRWLEAGPYEVAIPFGPRLAALVDPVAVRLRRDFGNLLGLIRAHALLHRATREVDAEGRIVATIDDYEAVYDLAAHLIADAAEASVPKTVRETVQFVADLQQSAHGGVSLVKLAKALKLDKSAASRRGKAAREAGYLTNLEDRPGRPARYVTDEPLPDEREVLPTPEALRRDCNPFMNLDNPPIPDPNGRNDNL